MLGIMNTGLSSLSPQCPKWSSTTLSLVGIAIFIMLLFDYIQYLLCMNLCLDFLWSEDSFNDSFLIDKVGGT